MQRFMKWVLLVLSFSPRVAFAQASANLSNADMMNSLNQYYEGEKATAFPFVFAASLTALVVGGIIIARGNQFTNGMGWPLLIIGLGVAPGAFVYSTRVTPEEKSFSDLLLKNPALYREKELAHMQERRENFRELILTDLSIALVGAGLAGYGLSQHKATIGGIGTGVMISFLALTVVEAHNRNRAIGYEKSVSRFHPAVGMSIDPEIKGASAIITARF